MGTLEAMKGLTLFLTSILEIDGGTENTEAETTQERRIMTQTLDSSWELL